MCINAYKNDEGMSFAQYCSGVALDNLEILHCRFKGLKNKEIIKIIFILSNVHCDHFLN